MRRTFLDDEREAAFRRDGYVTFPLLGPEEVARLRSAGLELHPSGEGFVTDVEQDDPDLRARVTALLAPVWDQHLPALLDRHRAFMTSFLVKWPGPSSDLYLHRDTTYVDEDRFRSVAFWVALDDADDELDNGPLLVLPGSHEDVEEYRGTNVAASHRPDDDAILPRMTSVPVRAGDVVVIDNRLLHGSGPNRSDRPRVAVAGAVVPAEADLVHAVAIDADRVGLLRVDDAFYNRSTPQGLIADPPAGPYVAEVPKVRRGPNVADAGELGSRPPEGGGLNRLLAANHRRVAKAWTDRPGPIYGAAVVPELIELEAAWADIRAEWDAVTSTGLRPLPMDLLAGHEFGADGSWDAVVLCHNGGWEDLNTKRFPVTTGVLRRLSGLRAALFSVLAPRATIPPHRGANNGVLRAHLGVVVPGGLGATSLEVGTSKICWEEGRAFAFDDTFVHAAHNRADDDRVVLMLELNRPLPRVADVRNRFVQRAFALHPQVRGGHRRLEEVDRAVNVGV
ncbi:MAG TPA: aspartyl/asparaginyl beta-hydroxylase domain-containing protein [Acidimicrobiales bacterium]|nr:aspartyl/asparaginyl beta-hydroxylase domain-containing protein [Acidimicrobiales bacterium]